MYEKVTLQLGLEPRPLAYQVSWGVTVSYIP